MATPSDSDAWTCGGRVRSKSPESPDYHTYSIVHTALECRCWAVVSSPSFPLSSLVIRFWHIFTVELSWPRSWSASSAREVQSTVLVASQRSFSTKAERSLWISWSFSWSGWDLMSSSSRSLSLICAVNLSISWRDSGGINYMRASLLQSNGSPFLPEKLINKALMRQTGKLSLFRGNFPSHVLQQFI